MMVSRMIELLQTLSPDTEIIMPACDFTRDDGGRLLMLTVRVITSVTHTKGKAVVLSHQPMPGDGDNEPIPVVLPRGALN